MSGWWWRIGGDCLQSPSRESVTRSLSFERRYAPFVMSSEGSAF